MMTMLPTMHHCELCFLRKYLFNDVLVCLRCDLFTYDVVSRVVGEEAYESYRLRREAFLRGKNK